MTRAHLRRRAVVLGLLLAVPALAQGAKDLCGDRPHCLVKGTHRALKGHEVVELSLGKTGEEDEGPKCEQKEWWLRRPDKSVVKLLDSCPADSGIGEDGVTVDKNRIRHVLTGGARERWEQVEELQLVPLMWASGEQVSYDALAREKKRARFNYTTFEGRSTWEPEDCENTAAQLVPQVEVPADFLSEGWKRMSLGSCSVDGSFVLLGKAQGKEDARIRAVLALKLQLLMNASGLTVIYSDSDAGKKQELMVGTSALKFGRAATLSSVWTVIPAQATCEVKENQLAPVRTELHPKPGEAAIPE